jgi:RNA:NAD 2'-phosphotransferase (TPT1/KptA family)
MRIFVGLYSLKSVVVPSVLYHATYKPLLKSILKNGLGSKTRKNWEDSVPGVTYLSDNAEAAESYAETSDLVDEEWLDEIVVLKVNTEGLNRDKFFVDRNNQTGDTFEYHGVIPKSNITIVD